MGQTAQGNKRTKTFQQPTFKKQITVTYPRHEESHVLEILFICFLGAHECVTGKGEGLGAGNARG